MLLPGLLFYLLKLTSLPQTTGVKKSVEYLEDNI